MTWNLLHMARMLKDAGGIPAHGNQRSAVGRRLPVRLPQPRVPLISLRAGVAADGWKLRVEADGERLDRDEVLLMAAVTNGSTIGGGRPVSPSADVSDGRLDVMVSHAVGPAARAAFGVGLARGTHGDRDDVVIRLAEVVRFGGHEAKFNVDGELWDRPIPDLEVRVAPGRLRMIVPG
jgi:diacylglycerol kinase (ATP)